jgi:hypothetical protein
LANLSALRYLRIWRTNLAFEKLLASGTPDKLTHFSFFGNKNIENTDIHAKLSALGYQEANWSNLPKV